MSVPPWRIVEYRGLAGLSELQDVWKCLYRAMPNPALWHSHEVFTAWAETLCVAPKKLRLLALSDGERIRAILPVEERRDAALGVPVRVWGMCFGDVWRLPDAIGSDGDALEALLPKALAHLGSLSERPAVFSMGASAETSVLWRGLERVKVPHIVFDDGFEARFPTDMSFERFEARMTSSARRAIHKARSNFEALDGAYIVRATKLDELVRGFEGLLEVEASGWKGEGGTAIRQQPGSEAFFRLLLSRVCDDGRCEIHALHSGDECIAATLSIFTRHQVTEYKSGYDPRFRKLAPGILVNHLAMEAACTDPAILEATAIGDEPWLERWRPKRVRLRRAYVALRPTSGWLLVKAFSLRFGPARAVARAIRRS